MADALDRLNALQAALPGIVERAVATTMQRAREIAEPTPVFRNVTGRLRKSIAGGITEATSTHVQGALSAGADDADAGKGGSWANPSREYAPHIELGTGRRGPQPFIHPAFTQAVTGEGVLGEALAEGIREALR